MVRWTCNRRANKFGTRTVHIQFNHKLIRLLLLSPGRQYFLEAGILSIGSDWIVHMISLRPIKLNCNPWPAQFSKRQITFIIRTIPRPVIRSPYRIRNYILTAVRMMRRRRTRSKYPPDLPYEMSINWQCHNKYLNNGFINRCCLCEDNILVQHSNDMVIVECVEIPRGDCPLVGGVSAVDNWFYAVLKSCRCIVIVLYYCDLDNLWSRCESFLPLLDEDGLIKLLLNNNQELHRKQHDNDA